MPSNLQQFKKKALSKPGVRAAYDELAEQFAFLDEVLKARTKTGLTHAEAAERTSPQPPAFRSTLTASQKRICE